MKRCTKRVWSNGDKEDCGIEAIFTVGNKSFCKDCLTRELERLYEVEKYFEELRRGVSEQRRFGRMR